MSGTVGINVVFTDLVGSTEMSSRLGPEASEELRQAHFGLLRSANEAHGGTEVKNLGDGLMVVFPSLTSALDGAVAMQQAIERHNASGKQGLGIRVGLSTGDATEEDGDYFGEPVVEAARLCAKCEAGQVITTELVSLLARSSSHAFESIGELELRGVPEPVPSVLVSWDPVQIESSVPMPDRLLPDMALPLAGRESELDSLLQAFKASESGERRISFLVGEPGIGKTRLSSEVSAEAHGRGATVLYGRCDEELSVPYQPWVEAITYMIENSPDEFIDEVVRLHGPELATVVPTLRRRFPDLASAPSSDAETERYMLLQAVTASMELLGAESPALLVLDDLHWADKQSLTLLRHVFTNMSSSSLMIIGTYRDSDLEDTHPLIDTVAALRREPGVELIPVQGLDDVDIVKLVEISGGQELDDAAKEMARALRRETAGNPFFAHEILRNMVESGDLYQDDSGDWIVRSSFEDLDLPQSVRDVVGQRIARLGEDSLKSLTAAAVIGLEFDLALLAAVTGTDEDDLLDQLEAATAAGILAEVPGGDERFRFQHTLARNTLSAKLSDGRRRRTHRKVAEALEASLGDTPEIRAGELATHWLAAAVPVEGARAIRYVHVAGRQALESLAPDEAVRWFTTALENLSLLEEPDEETRAALLVDLGIAQKHVGDATYRETLLGAGALAQRLDDTPLMVAAAVANSRGLYSKLGARDDDRIAALESALAAVGEDGGADRAMLLATLFSEVEYAESFEYRKALIDEALAIAREVDDPEVLVYVLYRSCVTSQAPQTLEARLSASAESVAIANDLGDPTLQFWAGCGAFQAAYGAGRVTEAHAALDQLTEAATTIGRPTFLWIAGSLNCSMLSTQGEADELERRTTENFALGDETGEPDAFDYFAIAVMTARELQGRATEVIGQLTEAAADNPEVPGYTAVEAMFHAENGDHERARGMLNEAANDDFEIRINNVWSTAIAAWAMTAHDVNDAAAARTLYGLLAPWSGQIVCNQIFGLQTTDGLLGRLAAVLGNDDQAEAHFAAAQELTDALGAKYFAANDDLARAGLHLARSDAAEPGLAERYATRALESAQANGYAGVEKRATDFLAALATT